MSWRRVWQDKRERIGCRSGFLANWFAAYTNSHHEKRVASHFHERQIESFLPLYSTRHRWKNGCDMNLELPLFPNYVFVHIDPRERVRILEVPGVLSLVGFGEILPHSPILKLRHSATLLDRERLSLTPTWSSASAYVLKPGR